MASNPAPEECQSSLPPAFLNPEVFFVVAAWLRSVAQSRWKNAFFGLNSRNVVSNPNRHLCVTPLNQRGAASAAFVPRLRSSITTLRLPLALTFPSFAVLPSLSLRSQSPGRLLLPFIPGLLVSTAFGMAKSAPSHST